MELLKKGLIDKMDKMKLCLIDRNKIPFKELWQEASCFADDIVCAVGTDFMLKIAEAERKFICDLLNSLQQMEVVDAVPVVRCKDCIRRYDTDECPMCFLIDGKYYEYTNGNGFCDRGERKEGVD